MANDATPGSGKALPGDVVAQSGSNEGVGAGGLVAATHGGYRVIVADFASEDRARQAYEALVRIHDSTSVDIEGLLVVKREPDGDIKAMEVTDRRTREGIRWGVVGGLVVGVLFPPSVIGSVLVGGLGGAAVGEVRKRHHEKEVAAELDGVLQIGHSGLVALVSEQDGPRIEQALDKADTIVAKAIGTSAAHEIHAAAVAAECDES